MDVDRRQDGDSYQYRLQLSITRRITSEVNSRRRQDRTTDYTIRRYVGLDPVS